MDPLSLLREYTMGKRMAEVELSEDACLFGDLYRFPRAFETAYRKKDGGRYPVEALVVLAKHLNVKHADYIKLARSQGVPIVTFTDRKVLQDYLEGKIAGTDAIELIAPVGVPSAVELRASSASASAAVASAAVPGSERGEDEQRASKRARAMGAHGEAATGEGPLGAADSSLVGKGEGLEGGDAVHYELQRIMRRERPLRSFGELFLCSKKPDVFAGILTLMEDLDKEKRLQEIDFSILRSAMLLPGCLIGSAKSAQRRAELAIASDRKRPASNSSALRQRDPGHASSGAAGKSAANGSSALAVISAPGAAATSAGAGRRGGEGGAGGASTALVPRPSAGGAAVASKGGEAEESRRWKAYMGTDAAEALGIDPTQSYMGFTTPRQPPTSMAMVPAGAPSSGPEHRPVPGGGSQGKPGSAAKPRQGAEHPYKQHRPPPGSAARLPAPRSAPGHAKGDGDGGPPIILVPSAMQTLINMYNVKDFLEDGVFVPPSDKMAALPSGQHRPEVVAFQRRLGRDRPVAYEAREKITNKRDWDRVVAVFVLGKEWQFKGWPFKDPVEALNNLMGVFVRFEDDSVEASSTVRQWNCSIISISKYKRHQDRTSVLTFWTKLDSFLRSRKSTLVF